MAIVGVMDILEHQLFVQRDARDPLGVWGARSTAVGDATGGTIKVGARVPIAGDPGRIYACYSVTITKNSGTDANLPGKVRLLTNFPVMDRGAGGQGYSTAKRVAVQVGVGFTTPIGMIDGGTPGITPPDRFILLFGPVDTDVNIVELEIAENEDLSAYGFEVYGYFWDRQVLYVAGGPRHPGEGQ